jgi:hypothetical protein
LLVEPAATNLLLRSEEFDDAAWATTLATISANATTAPNATTTADKIISTSGSPNVHIASQFLASAAANTYTASCYFKKDVYDYGCIRLNTDTAANRYSVVFDLSNGVFIQTITVGTPLNATFKITDAGAGWYRLSVTATHTSGDVQFTICGTPTSFTTAGALPVYSGDGTSGIFAWGAQLETGSVATSYIPTVAATATRNADVINKTGVSGFIGQTEGTIYAEVDFRAIGQARRVLCLSGNSISNRIIIGFEANNNLRILVTTGGALQFNSDTLRTTGIYKIAVGYAVNDFVLYVNGSQVATGSSGTIPACNSVFLGKQEDSNPNLLLNDRIRAAAIYPTRLTNSELSALTTL